MPPTSFAEANPDVRVFSDKDLKNNAVFPLCQRLATFQVHKDGLIVEARQLRGKARLSAMLGRATLTRSQFNRFSLLSHDEWRHAEEAWAALMLTVLVHPDFQPSLVDWPLIRAIQGFKKWFLRFLLSHIGIERFMSERSGREVTRLSGFERRLTLLCKGLKTLSSWLQWSALDFIENEQPAKIPWLPGKLRDGRPTMPWFAGHLAHVRFSVIVTDRSDREIAALCQLRTFGRALPPPGETVLRPAFDETVSVLCTEKVIKPEVLTAVREFSQRLGRKLKVSQMTLRTHLSVSTSGTHEASQAQGGKAEVCKALLEPLRLCSLTDTMCVEDFRSPSGTGVGRPLTDVLQQHDCCFDCYGQPLLFRTSLVQWASNVRENVHYFSGHPIAEIGPVRLIDVFYTHPANRKARKSVRKYLEAEVLPDTTGKCLLLMATAQAALYGSFVNPPSGYIVVPYEQGIYPIPYWVEDDDLPTVFVPEKPPRTAYTVLAEPGAKARPLGKNQIWLQLVQQAMRFMAEPIISRDGRARLGLESTNKLWDFLKSAPGSLTMNPRAIIMNSDFSSATDHIQFSLMREMWVGFLDGLKGKHPFKTFLGLLWFPRELDLDPRYGGGSALTRAGSMMGEPMSFLNLTLINLVLDEMATYAYVAARAGKPPLRPSETLIFARNPTAICGDDVVSLKPSRKASLLHKELVRSVGLVLSVKDGDSRRTLIFCEDHAIVTNRTGGVNTSKDMLYIDVVKLRLLTTMGRQHADNRVALLGKGAMLSKQLRWWPASHWQIKKICSQVFINTFNREYSNTLESTRLPIHLPPSCGGLSIPCDDKELPTWEIPYVKFVVWLTSQPKTSEMLDLVLRLRLVNGRRKYGLECPDTPEDALAHLAGYKYCPSTDASVVFDISKDYIYSTEQVASIVEAVTGRRLPRRPGQNSVPHGLLTMLGRECGLVPMWDAIDLIDRALMFNALLTGAAKEPKIRSLRQYERKSSAFWRHVESTYSARYIDVDVTSTAVGDLDWKVTTYWEGFVHTHRVMKLCARYGPNLALWLGPLQSQGTPIDSVDNSASVAELNRQLSGLESLVDFLQL